METSGERHACRAGAPAGLRTRRRRRQCVGPDRGRARVHIDVRTSTACRIRIWRAPDARAGGHRRRARRPARRPRPARRSAAAGSRALGNCAAMDRGTDLRAADGQRRRAAARRRGSALCTARRDADCRPRRIGLAGAVESQHLLSRRAAARARMAGRRRPARGGTRALRRSAAAAGTGGVRLGVHARRRCDRASVAVRRQRCPRRP